MSFLRWRDLVVGYASQRHPLTKSFSGEFTEPGIYAILGPNGCGKTTLLKTFLGILKPYSGTFDVELFPTSKISYVPQFSKVNHFLQITVKDFVAQGLGPNHTFSPADNAEIHRLLSQWQLPLSDNKKFHELSGGQKTRAMVARAIMSEPKLLFLDEPLASLDVCCQLQLMSFLFEWAREKKICVIMVDHHLQEYSRYIRGEILFSKGHDEEMSYVNVQLKN